MRPDAFTKKSIAAVEMFVLIALTYAYERRSDRSLTRSEWFNLAGTHLASVIYLS